MNNAPAKQSTQPWTTLGNQSVEFHYVCFLVHFNNLKLKYFGNLRIKLMAKNNLRGELIGRRKKMEDDPRLLAAGALVLVGGAWCSGQCLVYCRVMTPR